METSALEERLAAMDQKLDLVYVSTQRIYKFFLIFLIGSVVMLVLPVIGLMFAVPSFISTYQNMGSIVDGIK